MKSNIILVGLMGAGKSTIGRGLARLMGMEFYDSDRMIEQRTGVDISTIFEIEGEQGFRDREEQTIAELCAKQNIVLATGGGSVLRQSNRDQMKKSGHVIYLRTTAEVLFSRIRYDKSRPLMQTAKPIKTLHDLLREREPYYLDVADTVMKTGKQKVNVIIKRLYQLLKDRNIPELQQVMERSTGKESTAMADNNAEANAKLTDNETHTSDSSGKTVEPEEKNQSKASKEMNQ